MLKFIIKRLWYGFLVLLGAVLVVFLLFNILPGDPTKLVSGKKADPETQAIISKDLGLDQPLHIQFLLYLNDLSPLSLHNPKIPASRIYLDEEKYSARRLLTFSDNRTLVLKYPYLRRSYQDQQKVSDMILEALPETIILAFSAILFAIVFGIAFGIIAAMNQGRWPDHVAVFLSSLGVSGPTFLVGIIFIWVFAYHLGDYTGLNLSGTLFPIDDYGTGEYLELKNLILPALTLGIRPLALVTQLTRNSLLETMNLDFIRTARAKGLKYWKLVVKHALRHALNPVLTAVSGWFAGLMAGAVFVEYVFDWKGIGYEIVSAMERYDFPVIMGVVLVITCIFVVINILVDITYGWLDPRIRVKS